MYNINDLESTNMFKKLKVNSKRRGIAGDSVKVDSVKVDSVGQYLEYADMSTIERLHDMYVLQSNTKLDHDINAIEDLMV